MDVHVFRDEVEVLRGVLSVGAKLALVQDRHRMLNMILREARKLMHAEAGALYVVRRGRLKFMAAQNERCEDSSIPERLLTRELPLSSESLAGHVACTGEVANLPNARRLPKDAPYRVDFAFDALNGYRTESILALPLKCPDGRCLGVLELINCIGLGGRVVPFGNAEDSGVAPLASMAAVTIHNFLLQDQLKEAHLDTIIRLSTATEYKHAGMGDHIRRISLASAMVAEALGLPVEQVELVRYASPMHDIGKIGIPDAILGKQGPLTDRERRIMQRHTIIGGEILDKPKTRVVAAARDVALSHHERWDGQGYPHGLAGDDIPLHGRIVGITDVFDALVTPRPYKETSPIDQAFETIHAERERAFDPAVCDAFSDCRDRLGRIYDALAEAEELLKPRGTF